VRFHDGSPFDAKAVKWNFDRLIDPAVRVPIRAAYPIEKTDVVDPLTVRITLKHPYAAFLGALSSTTSGLLSPASAVAPGNDYKSYVHIVEPVRTRSRSGGRARASPSRGIPRTGPADVIRVGRRSHRSRGSDPREPAPRGPGGSDHLPPLADVPALQRNPALKVLLAPSDRTIFVAINTGSRCSPTGACGRRSTTRWTRRRS